MDLMRPDIERMLRDAGLTPREFMGMCLSGELGYSVTGRANSVEQPYGGFLPIKQFDKTLLGEGEHALHPVENVHGSLIGIAVDYMTRVMLGTSVSEAFRISFDGAEILDEDKPWYHAVRKARFLAAGIGGLDKTSLSNAIKLTGFDVCKRAGSDLYTKPIEEINPDDCTIYNVRTMVERSLHFFDVYGPKVLSGFNFEGGYTLTVITGDGDFTTADTLWDFKVCRQPIKKKQTLQLLMYWRMGLRSIHPEFQSIEYLGFYNPRTNVVRRVEVSDISTETIRTVDRCVIGYRD